MSTLKIISGGQTGADRAALDAAIANNVNHGGYCPKGRRAEDGNIPSKYSLIETDSSDYAIRTRKNVITADATLIIYHQQPDAGTALTLEYARAHSKPVLQIDIADPIDHAFIIQWLMRENVKVLNVAGPRLSQYPKIYAHVYAIIDRLLNDYTRFSHSI